MIDVRALKKQRAEVKNAMIALSTGKDKKGLTYRPLVLIEDTRGRGGRKSRRRTARVWKPA